MLILKTGATFPEVVAARGDYEDWFLAGLGIPAAAARVVDLRAGERPPAPEDVGGAIITGSSAMVTDREPWSEALVPWLREALARELPLLAVCYGHQLLADALGGEVGYNPRGRQIGTIEVRRTEAAADDPLLGALPDPLVVQATHRQSVARLPPGIESLATSPRDPHHAFRAGPRAWAVQFHPEIDHDAIREYITRRVDAIRDEGDDPDALLANLRASDHGTRLLRRFADLAGR